MCLPNPGDVVVNPVPAYLMSTCDFGIKLGIRRFDLQSHDNPQEIGTKAPLIIDLLESAWLRLRTEGGNFKYC